MLVYLGNLNVLLQTCWSSQLCLETEGKEGFGGLAASTGNGACRLPLPHTPGVFIGNTLEIG